MRCVKAENIRVFADRVLPALAQSPIEHSLLLTLIEVRAHRGVVDHESPLCVYVEGDSGEVVGVAFQTPPRGALLSFMDSSVATFLGMKFADFTGHIPSVSGPKDSAKAFAEEWSAHAGVARRQGDTQRMYALNELEDPAVRGLCREITPSDRALVLDWWRKFHAETSPDANRDAAAELEQRLKLGAVFIWELDGTPVAMAGYAGPSFGVARIGPVYTPPEFRGAGFGSAITAAATKYALNRGAKDVMLYTDLANDTSNKIYQRIGFRPFSDVQDWHFG